MHSLSRLVGPMCSIAATDAIPKKGKIATERVIGEDLSEDSGESSCCAHRSSMSTYESQPQRLMENMGVERDDKGAFVDVTAPQSKVDR